MDNAIIIVKTVVLKTLKNWTVKITDFFYDLPSPISQTIAYTTLIEQKDNHNVFCFQCSLQKYMNHCYNNGVFTLSCPTPVYILCIYSANCLQLAKSVCKVHA